MNIFILLQLKYEKIKILLPTVPQLSSSKVEVPKLVMHHLHPSHQINEQVIRAPAKQTQHFGTPPPPQTIILKVLLELTLTPAIVT